MNRIILHNYLNAGFNRSTVSMKPWIIVVSPKFANLVLLSVSLLLISIGLALIIVSNNYKYCELTYDSSKTASHVLVFDNESCPNLGSVLDGKYSLYYQLNNYYQNHKKFRLSIDYRQFMGQIITDEKALSSCEPFVRDKNGKILHPCGCIALHVFTDHYKMYKDVNLTVPIELDESRDAITPKYGVHTLFKEPPRAVKEEYKELIHFWTDDPKYQEQLSMNKPGVGYGVENSHLINWIDVAAHTKFKKLYGVINADQLQLPLYIRVDVNYIVMPTEAKRQIILAKQTFFGESAFMLSIFYLITGIFAYALYLTSWRYIRQNYYMQK